MLDIQAEIEACVVVEKLRIGVVDKLNCFHCVSSKDGSSYLNDDGDDDDGDDENENEE